MFSTKHCFGKKAIKIIGHHARLRDVMGQLLPRGPIYILVLITRFIHRSSLHFAVAGNIVW